MTTVAEDSELPLVESSEYPRHIATRRLCAGTYLDHDFRESIMRYVYLARGRQIAPSYGFDAVPVIVHARRATRIDGAQHLLLVAAIVFWFISRPLVGVVATCVMISWFVLKALAKLLRDIVQFWRKRGSLADRMHLRRRRNYLLPALIVPWLGAYVASFQMKHTYLMWAEANPRRFGVEVGAAIVSLAVVIVAVSMARHLGMATIRTDPTISPISMRLNHIAATQHLPITLYAGFRPFVGAGFEVRTWSIAQRLEPSISTPETNSEPEAPSVPRQRQPEEPYFRTPEITQFVHRAIRGLRYDDDPELRLPNLEIFDHIFVSGGNSSFLAGKTDLEVVAEVMNNPSDPQRHYTECRVASWGGEVVTSVFVHTSIQGNTLYVEFSTRALPPTQERFRHLDEPGGQGLRGFGTAINRVVWKLPAELSRIPYGLYRLIAWPLSWLRPGQEACARLGMNVGARYSLREAAAELETDEDNLITTRPKMSYFQLRDVVKYLTVVERRLLGAVVDFLDSHNLNTSEFRQQSVAILNQGVMTYGGGSASIVGSAVGQNATVTTPAAPTTEMV